MPTPDALPASQLPRALWEAGVRPAGVFCNPHADGRLDEGEPGEWWRPWEPHRKIAHCYLVLAWARQAGYGIQLRLWQAPHGLTVSVSKHGAPVQSLMAHDPTEAAECEAICRAVLRAVRGGTP